MFLIITRILDVFFGPFFLLTIQTKGTLVSFTFVLLDVASNRNSCFLAEDNASMDCGSPRLTSALILEAAVSSPLTLTAALEQQRAAASTRPP